MTRKTKNKRLLVGITLGGVCVLAWISWKGLRPFVMLGYVDTAIGRVRTVVAAEAEFAKANPTIGYACMLSQLSDDDQVLRRIKNGKDNGYAFEIECNPSPAGEPQRAYRVIARPFHAGLPAFCSDQSGILRIDQDGSVEKCVGRASSMTNC